MKNNQFVVTGASGFVAKSIRKFLSDKNIQVIAISRKNFKKFQNEIKIVSPNYDEKIILPKIRNANALIHLAGIGKQSVKYNFNQINLEFTKKIINLCLKTTIQKIVFTSGLGVSRTTPLGYFISKYHAETQIIQSGLNYTIFRPSYIVGKDDLFTKFLKKQLRRGKILIPGSGQYSIQPIYINDVCKIIFESILSLKFRNKVLDLVGPESITYEEYVKLFSEKTKTKIFKIDLEKAYYNAISSTNPEFGIDDLNLLIGDFKGNYKKLQSISKIKCESIKDLLKTGRLF
ncbi:MAG: NAD-dependent epimerase/dehydratase family protein [Nitrosopumilaceae archaeon]|nr:NAD-dependent epimerase/dehydratase family protein [Nitrosopumilaceae archaeon]